MFLQSYKFRPSDRQLVHLESKLHRCASDQRLLEIPASCLRVTEDNPLIYYIQLAFFND